jgi:hypothetical protein
MVFEDDLIIFYQHKTILMGFLMTLNEIREIK